MRGIPCQHLLPWEPQRARALDFYLHSLWETLQAIYQYFKRDLFGLVKICRQVGTFYNLAYRLNHFFCESNMLQLQTRVNVHRLDLENLLYVFFNFLYRGA